MMKKTFLLGVGAQKSGTTWLHHYLSSQIFANFGFEKEYHIFDTLTIPCCAHFRESAEEMATADVNGDITTSRKSAAMRRVAFMSDLTMYFEYFCSLLEDGGIFLTGDVTPSYSGLSAETYALIRQNFESRGITVKPVFLMRNPVYRLQSMARMHLRAASIHPTADQELEEMNRLFLTDADLTRVSYHQTIPNLERVFADDLYLNFYERFFEADSIADLGRFLGMDLSEADFTVAKNVSRTSNILGRGTYDRFRDGYAEIFAYCQARFGRDLIDRLWAYGETGPAKGDDRPQAGFASVPSGHNLRDPRPGTPRHHLLIAGTGRAGTTLLVQLLDRCGLDTHLSRNPAAAPDARANAGLEDLLFEEDAPYVVKSPWSHAFLETCLSRGTVAVDAVIIPVRDLGIAAASRIILEVQDRYEHAADAMAASGGAWGEWGTVRGGMTYAIEPLDQERILAVGFHRLVECLVRFDVPVILLDYPRFAVDAAYLFEKLAPVIEGRVDRAGFKKAFQSVADPAMARTEAVVRNATDMVASAAEAASDQASRVRLEIEALHRVVADLRARNMAAEARGSATQVEGERLRRERDAWAAEADRLKRERTELDAEMERLRGESDHLAAETGRLWDENGSQASMIEQLRGERDALVAQTARLERTRIVLEAEGDRLRQEQGQSAADVGRVRAEHDTLAVAAEQWRRERDGLAAETDRLRGLCVELQTKFDIDRSLSDLHRHGAAQAELLRQIARRRRSRQWWDWLWIWPRLRGPWFDRGHYLSQAPTLGRGWLPLRLHYLLLGRRRDASPAPLFDPAYYRQRYPDVAASGMDPLFHYLRHGAAEGRKPSPAFDSGYYLAQNPDVARQRANPLRHYLNHGWREGRDPNPLFDTSFYLAAGDVEGEPLAHYLSIGAGEGRRPGPLFDGARYLAENPDVAAAGLNPLVHYLDHGLAEGRPRPEGDALPMEREDRGRVRILLVLHGLGGGVERHCADLETLLTGEGADVWRLEGIADGAYRLRNRARAVERGYLNEGDLLPDLRRLGFDLVHVHHVIGFGTRLRDWLVALDAPYDVTVHDYAFVCPRVTLLDGSNRYCGEPADVAACDRCLALAGAHPYLASHFAASGGVRQWREASASLLAGARRVYVPDPDVAERLKRYFPPVAPLVRPHPEPPAPIPTRPPVGGERVRIAVIGSIGPHKGFDILLACARAARRDRLPLTFVVIGEVCAPERLAGLETIEVTGRYREEDLPRLIGAARCHAAAFLSVWPETYMYTLSAALRSGLYPAVLDFGAPARRVRQLAWGEILPPDCIPEDINRRLMEIAIDHPIPTSDLVVGHAYPSLLKGYYGIDGLLRA